MATTQEKSLSKTKQAAKTAITVLRWMRWGVVIVGGLILLALFGGLDAIAPVGQVQWSGHDRGNGHIALDIMAIKPGGPAENYAAYLPSTALNVPAQSLVTVTIRNFDLDTIPLPDNSPYTRVQGTISGVAYADGKAYTALARTGIAHTFTIPDLHLSVPIPGQSASGKHFVTVTFSFRTGPAGVFSWRCFAPCGDEPNGQAGAMAEAGYMRGTLFVER
jgi:hypothetical protein